ncbi:hypothetical protein JXA05_02420 [Candidatus Peregrinibacteria bacterium]|nr:hypothetical protein [Candidatus Peregrinibacteria bacterium]
MNRLAKILLSVIVVAALVSFYPISSSNAAIFEGNPEDEKTEVEYGIEQVKESLAGAGVTHTDTLGQLIVKYVNFALPYLALAAFVGFVVAGFMYVTAYGNEEQLGKAKKILIWSIVGLLLVIASYSIVSFLTKGLVERLQ